MTFRIQGIDIDKALDLYDDDEDILLAVLRSYAANTSKVLDRLRNVSSDTLSDYTAAVHGVKGTSTNIGAEEVRKEAAELEIMAKNGNLSGILARNEQFLKKADALVANIKDWLTQYDAKK